MKMELSVSLIVDMKAEDFFGAIHELEEIIKRAYVNEGLKMTVTSVQTPGGQGATFLPEAFSHE